MNNDNQPWLAELDSYWEDQVDLNSRAYGVKSPECAATYKTYEHYLDMVKAFDGGETE